MIKKQVLFICAFYSLSAHAQNTTQWYINENLYDVTTCESGGNIVLPTPPEKQGYTFIGWAKADFLQPNGNAYINTQYLPNQNTRIMAAFTTGLTGGTVFGTRTALYTANSNSLSFSHQYNYIRSDCPNYERVYKPNKKFSDKFFIGDNDRNTFLLYDDNNSLLYSQTVAQSNWQTPLPLYLFASNDRGLEVTVDTGDFKIHYVKIYESDVLIHDYVPVIDENAIPCMYDRIEDKYLYSAGSGDFIIGNKYNNFLTDNNICNKENRIFFAVFEPNTLTLNWDYKDETGRIEQTQCVYDTPITDVPEAPVRAGYKFMGWRVKEPE